MISRTIFIQQPCYLKLENNQLVASYTKIEGEIAREDRKAPIEDLGLVVLEHRQITVTHALLSALIEHNVALVTCNEKLLPVGMFLNLEGNTLQSERFKWQVEASEPLKKQLWQQTIISKVKNQAAVLKKWEIENSFLLSQSAKVKSGDTDNVEAKCSYYYWQHLFPSAWQFYRKRDGAPPNNLLNYGYAVIRASMARAITGAGLLPTFGIFHRNRYNAYCLADDLMEPYRPYIDIIVRQIVDETSIVNDLTQDFKTRFYNVLTTDVKIDNKTSPLMVAMQRTANSMVKCLSGESRKMLYPQIE